MRRMTMYSIMISMLLAIVFASNSRTEPKSLDMNLKLRTRIRPFPIRDNWTAAEFQESFATSRSAIIITDMWDKHWCRGATGRVEQIARRMEPLLQQARSSGILIIHAPSDTMAFYAGTPARQLALDAPRVASPRELVLPNAPLPIDDSDGGCDTPGDKEHVAWTRETPLLTIAPGDVVSDSGEEIYNVLRQHGIDTIFIMGVHANMCILNRTFGIRQMSRWGIRCVLVRDLTDAMYDSRSRPFVSHAAGTELVIEYIEQHWAPTVTSTNFLQALRHR